MIHYLLSFIFLVQSVYASEIFTAIELTSQSGNNKPLSPWTATVSYNFEDLSQYSTNDVFKLTMPNVYRVKFTDDSTTLTATLDGETLFTCGKKSGAYFLDYSELSCTIKDGLFDSSLKSVSGDIQFTVFFGVGGSAYSVEIEDANAFTTGENTITWNDDLSTKITLAAQASTDGLYTFSHTTGHDSVEDYFLFPACDDGTQSGSIELDFGANVGGQGEINCDLTQIYITNELNSWLFPKSYEQGDIYQSCSSSKITLTYSGLPAGYRIFVTTFQYQSTTQITLTNEINYNVVCPADSTTISTDYYQNIGILARQATATAVPMFITTSGYDGSTTGISTSLDPSPTAGTIFVLTPNPKPSTTTTTTATWSNSYTSTTTEPFSSGDKTITVDVDVPAPEPSTTTTTTATWSNSYTTTTTEPFSSGDKTITVDVDVPAPEPSTTTTTAATWSNSYTSTTTEPFSSGDKTITVDVDVPAPEPSTTTTTTATWSNSYTSTTTEPFSSGDKTITVDVDVPRSNFTFETTIFNPAKSTVSSSIECSECTETSVIKPVISSTATQTVGSSETTHASGYPGTIGAIDPCSSNFFVSVPTIVFSLASSESAVFSESTVEASVTQGTFITETSKVSKSNTQPTEAVTTYLTTSDNTVLTVTKTLTNYQTQYLNSATAPKVSSSITTAVIHQPSSPSGSQSSTTVSLEQYEGSAAKSVLSHTFLYLSSFLFFTI